PAIHVEPVPYAETFQIPARFDGTSGTGQSPPLVVRLIIVEVDAVPMDALAETMAGPMQNLLCRPGAFEDLACGPIDLPAAQLPAVARRLFHQPHRSIARLDDGGEGAGDRRARLRPRVANPRDISKDRARTPKLSPQI